jgi:hypothetical protein
MSHLQVGCACAILSMPLSLSAVGVAPSRAGIAGRAPDQRAAIPRVSVTIPSRRTGVTTRAVTNPTGYYEADFRNPETSSFAALRAEARAAHQPGRPSATRRHPTRDFADRRRTVSNPSRICQRQLDVPGRYQGERCALGRSKMGTFVHPITSTVYGSNREV